MLLPQTVQNRFLHSTPMRKGRVCFDKDIPLLKPLRDLGSIAPRMQLVLPDIDLPTAAIVDVFFQFVEVMNSVIGYAD